LDIPALQEDVKAPSTDFAVVAVGALGEIDVDLGSSAPDAQTASLLPNLGFTATTPDRAFDLTVGQNQHFGSYLTRS
jgi:hypothetical protein